MQVKRLYRKMMRKVCRYILGFERCPIDCKREYKEMTLVVIDAFIVTFVSILILLGLFLITN